MKIVKKEKPFRLIGNDENKPFFREFSSVKALRLYTNRHPNINATPYMLHGDQWERFVIDGSRVYSKSQLETMLASIQETKYTNQSYNNQ